ncbi:MAG: S16 family serine protease [Bacilli bacterium]
MKKYLTELWIHFKGFSGWKRIVSIATVVLYSFILVISLVKINYICLTPGTISPVSSTISISSSEETNPIYTVSVYEYRKISILHYWLSLANDEVELTKFDPATSLSDKEEAYQGELMKQNSITNSIIMAYVEAAKYNDDIVIDYDFNGLVVVGLDRTTDSDLQLGDLITHLNGTILTSYNQFMTLIRPLLQNEAIDTVDMTLVRNDKSSTVEVSIQSDVFDGQSMRYLSLLLYEDYTIHDANPRYEEVETVTSGPSGGLMQALAVYDAITSGDLTRGLRILGTGTIEVDGTVGAIGGVKQKIITANLYQADYFFVPQDNYEEAMEQYVKLDNPSYSAPISVSSFADAIAFLEGLEG